MTETDIGQGPSNRENEDLFITDNLLVRSSTKSLSAKITKTWVSLNEQDKTEKNSARRSITSLIQTLWRKTVLPGHDCWTSNPHAASIFVHHIVNSKSSKAQNKPKPWKRKLDQYLKSDSTIVEANDGKAEENFLSLNKKQYLSFNYAALNLPTDPNDLHEVIHRHISYHKVNKSDIDSRQYLEEVFKQKDRLNLPILLVEEIVQVIPNVIEMELIEFALKMIEAHKNIGDDDDQIVYPDISNIMDTILLCTRSQICFKMCILILNTLFIQMDCSDVIYIVIQAFITKLQELIGMPKFILLYPEEYQTIIQRMQLTIDSNNTKIVFKFCQELVQNGKGKMVFMLLTHNPKWFDLFKNDIKLITSGYIS